MALNQKSMNIKGVWGPYFGVILKNLYLSEGGQSAAGKLLDHVVTNHPAYPELKAEAKSHGAVLSKLEQILATLDLKNSGNQIAQLTKDLHIWPDFHGNRSPIADPTLRGMISGLTLSNSREDLAILYLATIQSLAYGSRHIKDAMEESGHEFNELVICGGLSKSKLFVQSHADCIGLPVIVPNCPEPVLLGAAISAAAAANSGELVDSLSKMAGGCNRINPNVANKEFHDKKYKVFRRMLQDQIDYSQIMSG
jgi:FGGY-family pentulose kinase